ncbi:MAG: beta-ketoacyl-ACP synthase II [Myxococcota bacterium]
MTRLTDSRGRPRVVVTGMGMVTPCGASLESTWRNLVAGRSGIKPITRFDISEFETKIAGEATEFVPTDFMDPKEVRRNDRFIQFAVAAADMAMRHAEYTIAPSEAGRVGVVVGAGLGGLELIEANAKIINERGPRKITPFFIPGLIVNLAPGQISIRIGAKGPNWSPVSACSTSAHAIGEAAETIRRGICDVVVTGGSEATITPLGIGGFNAMKALSTRNDEPHRASRPWDKDRDGFVMGEGAGVLVIETLKHALDRGARILAEVLGYGASADAAHITQVGDGPKQSMRMCLEDAGLAPEQIGYVNAHATSTPMGDPKEVESLKAVMGDHATRIPVSSTKSAHGHMLGAAGAVETIVTIQALMTETVPPTLNLDTPDEGCDLNFVPHEAQRHSFDAAMSNSFGFGGTNATVVVGRLRD